MQQLEDGWPGALPRPIYLFADGGRLEELTAATATNTSLRQRVLGTAPGKKTANYANWATAFNGFHGHAPLTYADTAYDSAYLLAFAVAWLGHQPITGAGLAEGLAQTIGGPKIVPGVNGLADGYNELQAGNPIDYDGISGPLDFDLATGEAPADIDIWCVQPGGGGFVASGQFYDAVQEVVVGTRNQCESALND
jgi:branched-chain amino acid transport system substrate-binding protein